MSLYLEHRKCYIACKEAEKMVEAILDEREVLLQRVQPKSSLAEHEREHMPSNPQGGGQRVNKAEEFVIEAERRKIRERLEDARELLADRRELLVQKEAELLKSRDVYNVIYSCKWVYGMKADAIVQYTNYSRSQIYAIIKHIKRQIERN